MSRLLLATVVTVLGMVASSDARADDAQQVFDSLYGNKIKAVNITADRADDVALAVALVSAAKTSTDSPALLALLCEAAHELGQRHADGYGSAAQAMDLLAQTVEAKRQAALEKLVEMLTKQSRAGKADERDAATVKLIDTLLAMGDEKMEAKKWSEAAGDYRRAMLTAAPKKLPQADDAKARTDEAMRLDRAAKQMDRLQERLLGNANDTAAAEEIARLALLELNQPEEAKKIYSRLADTEIKAIVELVNRPLGQLKAVDHIRIGEWYHVAARNLRGVPKLDALNQAREKFSIALSEPSIDGLARTKVDLLAKAVQGELDALATANVTRPTAGKTPSTFLPLKAFEKVFTRTDGLSVQNGLVIGRTGNLDEDTGPRLLTTVEGRTLRFGLKMKAPSYQSIWALANDVGYFYSRGHWLNEATSVKGNRKAEIRLQDKVANPNEFALLELEYTGKEIRYYYNGKLAFSDKLVTEGGPMMKFNVGFRTHHNLMEVKDIYLIVDGKSVFGSK